MTQTILPGVRNNYKKKQAPAMEGLHHVIRGSGLGLLRKHINIDYLQQRVNFNFVAR